MSKPTILDIVREWIGGGAFKVFLWSIRMTQDEYLDLVAPLNVDKELDESYCLCKLSVRLEDNICVNCGLPYKHIMDK